MAPRSLVFSVALLSISSFFPHDAGDHELGIVRITAVLPDGAVALFTGTHLGDGWVLTCGHCCEARNQRVDVRILSSKTWTPVRRVKGTVICHDQEADVGFIRLTPQHGLRTAYRLAPRDYRLRPGDAVSAYDWRKVNDREQLYSITRRVTGINVYVAPGNIETSGLPKPGASGGPLVVQKDGWIVGVTTSGNLDDRRGIHTGLSPIYRLIDRCLRRRMSSQRILALTARNLSIQRASMVRATNDRMIP